MTHPTSSQYIPYSLPLRIDDLANYIHGELHRISAAFGRVESIQLVELNEAPDKPRDGMIILADGTNFDPGSGQGMYGRINGAWVKLG